MPTLSSTFHLAVMFAFALLGCNKTIISNGGVGSKEATAPHGNGQGYGGGDLAWSRLMDARLSLTVALTQLQNGVELNRLGIEDGCDSTREPLICPKVRNATTADLNAVREFISETRVQYLNFLSRDPESLFKLSKDPLVVGERRVNAKTQVGPDGPIEVWIDGLSTPLSTILLLTHEIGHKVARSASPNYLSDANGGEDFLNMTGAMVAWYAENFASPWDNVSCDPHYASCNTNFGSDILRDGQKDTVLGRGDFRLALRVRISSPITRYKAMDIISKRSICGHQHFFQVSIAHGLVMVYFVSYDPATALTLPPGSTGKNWLRMDGAKVLDDGNQHQLIIERRGLTHTLYIDGALKAQVTALNSMDLTDTAAVQPVWRLGSGVCNTYNVNEEGGFIGLDGTVKVILFQQ